MIRFFSNSQDFSRNLKQHGKVTIIMRTKDRPVLLARALASVLAQTYDNWHLSLINDGGDPEAVNQLLKIHAATFRGRLTVKHHAQSLGMEAASNAAIAGTSGDYLVVHDDDDSWRPTFLEETVAFLENPRNARYVAVATKCEVVREEIINFRIIEREVKPFPYWRERIDLAEMLVGNAIPNICLLIRREVIKQIGSYNADLPVLGDWDYNLRILLLGDIGTIDQSLACYHQRGSHDASDSYGNSIHAGLNKHLDYQVLYRNSLLRMQLAKQPEFTGMMHTLLHQLSEQTHQLNHLEQQLQQAMEHRFNQLIEHQLQQAIEQRLKPMLEDHFQQIHEELQRAAFNDRQLADDLRIYLRQMRKLLKPFRLIWLLIRPIWRLAKKLRGK